jgi:hypothetical protein
MSVMGSCLMALGGVTVESLVEVFEGSSGLLVRVEANWVLRICEGPY